MSHIIYHILFPLSPDSKKTKTERVIFSSFPFDLYLISRTLSSRTWWIFLLFCIMWNTLISCLVQPKCSLQWTPPSLDSRGEEEARPFTLKIDNQSAIQLSRHPVFYERSKHIDTRYHFHQAMCGGRKGNGGASRHQQSAGWYPDEVTWARSVCWAPDKN
jgi:hypothetical protein